MTYRRRYFAEARIGGVLDLLLLDPTNPRAVAFQLAVLEHHAAGLPAGPNPEGVAEFQQRLAALPANWTPSGPRPLMPGRVWPGRSNGWPVLPWSWAVCPSCSRMSISAMSCPG